MRSGKPFQNELNQALDYHDVLTQIAAFVSFSRSAQEIREAMPKSDLLWIREQLGQSAQAFEFLQAGHAYTAGQAEDVEDEVLAASKGVSLLPQELLSVASFLSAVYQVKSALNDEGYPILMDLAGQLDPCRRLFEDIMAKIDLSGSIREDATPRLRSLHRRIIQIRAELNEKGRNFIRHHADSLMENMTTTIGGRMSVLLKASEKNRFGGMLHGSSQSGLAFYVEPSEFVELNNDLQGTAQEIEEEKKIICKDLSRQVKNQASAILSDLETLTVIDIAFAKARWMAEHDGCIPQFSETGKGFVMEHAVHPMLDRRKAVPNTYKLDPSQLCLMMSGPNMGGKTVTLKTIGLFIALAQAGFPVSAHRVRIPLFENMFFDIGDNQSIENNLSTFSAHASRLSEMTSHADDATFMLLDEIGSGTDPLEGASLAQAVIEYLLSKKSMVITSTHFDEVKAFGKADPAILVSSVEFDPQTLKPTYRYLPGISGASYAFDIAENFDFDPSILQRARSLKKSNETEVQKQLESLEKLQNQARRKQERFDKMIEDAHRIQKEADHQKNLWENKKKRLDDEYEEKLQRELDEKKEEARKILKEIRTSRQGGMSHEQIARMREIDELAPRTEKKQGPVDETLKVGDYVHIEMLNSHGEITSIGKKKATVMVNGRKVEVSLDQLQRISRPKVQKPKRQPREDKVFETIPLELNLIGMRVEEGIRELDHYLDQAVYHRIKNVRIIHGMGTGALRTAVWKDLKKHPQVAKFTSAGPGEGGLGATLVELK